ncbi:hypothetical protein V6N13_109995 [Hibiscus sabdariffa]|uniref:Uncharacterized protein n=2 Tax=Hibiscus sabdariffa TaxID=183260 RepID=A0ABR2AH47_9ROSI
MEVALLYVFDDNESGGWLQHSISLERTKGWNGLLHPLDLDLRRYIIHYGERAASVGDLYHMNKDGGCPKQDFFAKACLEKDEGKAVLGRRDILIAWRGTITSSEWFNNAAFFRTSASDLFGDGTEALVHSGFQSLYTGTSPDSADTKISARNQYPDEELSITVIGFSLGAALAALNAMDIANGYNDGEKKSPCTVTAFTFGAPRVGNNGYTHLGNELQINTGNSPYLKWRWIGASAYVSSVKPESVPNSDGITTEEEIVMARGVGEHFSAHNMDVYNKGLNFVLKLAMILHW